jgi:hypothetical protein
MIAAKSRRVFLGRVASVLAALGVIPAVRGTARESHASASSSERFITSSPTSKALRRVADESAVPSVQLLRDAADEIDRLRDALFWCGGSPSFAPGGEAEEGWRKMVGPLMRPGA